MSKMFFENMYVCIVRNIVAFVSEQSILPLKDALLERFSKYAIWLAVLGVCYFSLNST